MGVQKYKTAKKHHRTFQITATFETWIEPQDDGLHVYQRLCTAGSLPVEVGIYTDQAQASAHQYAIETLLAPNTIEGSTVAK